MLTKKLLAGYFFIFFPVIHHLFHIGLRPLRQLPDKRKKRFPNLGKPVFNLWGYNGINFSIDKSVSFQCAQCRRKHS